MQHYESTLKIRREIYQNLRNWRVIHYDVMRSSFKIADQNSALSSNLVYDEEVATKLGTVVTYEKESLPKKSDDSLIT